MAGSNFSVVVSNNGSSASDSSSDGTTNSVGSDIDRPSTLSSLYTDVSLPLPFLR